MHGCQRSNEEGEQASFRSPQLLTFLEIDRFSGTSVFPILLRLLWMANNDMAVFQPSTGGCRGTRTAPYSRVGARQEDYEGNGGDNCGTIPQVHQGIPQRRSVLVQWILEATAKETPQPLMKGVTG